MLKKLLALVAVGTAALSANADVIWTGSAPLDWNNGQALQIEATNLAAVQAGDVILATFSVDAGASYGNIFFCTGLEGWPQLTNNNDRSNQNAYNSYAPGTTESSVKVAAADVAGLKEAGLVLMGEKVTVTKVELVAGADAPAENVWTGNEYLENWANLAISASYCKNLKEGDQITMYFTVGSYDTYGKVILKDGNWAELNDLQATLTNVDEYGAFQPDVTSATMTVNASNAAALASSGLIITGYNLTITKVVFGGEESGDNGGGTTPSDNSVWTGNEYLENWTNLVIPASYCKNLVAGDKITMYFTVGTYDTYGKVILKDGDWAELNALQATLTNVDAYGAFQPDVTSASMTVDATNAATLVNSGLIITGYNLTVTKVEFGEKQGSTGVQIVESNNAPVEYYNLQGVRLSEPAAGTIVIRRQGNEVKKIIF